MCFANIVVLCVWCGQSPFGSEIRSHVSEHVSEFSWIHQELKSQLLYLPLPCASGSLGFQGGSHKCSVSVLYSISAKLSKTFLRYLGRRYCILILVLTSALSLENKGQCVKKAQCAALRDWAICLPSVVVLHP